MQEAITVGQPHVVDLRRAARGRDAEDVGQDVAQAMRGHGVRGDRADVGQLLFAAGHLPHPGPEQLAFHLEELGVVITP